MKINHQAREKIFKKQIKQEEISSKSRQPEDYEFQVTGDIVTKGHILLVL